MTAAGVATLGLACGVGQPALAEWWKSQTSKPPNTAAKPAEPQNGFAATIRRLMAESRHAAEQGDHAKAVQLAERAAKISEASSQLLGTASEYSPQETTRFLAEVRLRHDQAITEVAARPTPLQPAKPAASSTAMVGATNANARALAAASETAAKSSPLRSGPTPSPLAAAQASSPKPLRSSQSAPPPPSSTSAAAARRADTAVASTGPPLFGDRRNGSVGRRTSNFEANAGSRPESSIPPFSVPPSPAVEPVGVYQLLAQSRLAAADGNMDRAIEFAEQAVDTSNQRSFFGPAVKSPIANEAHQWLDKLVAQYTSPVREHEVEIEPPIKVALKTRSVADAASDEMPAFDDEVAASEAERPEPSAAVASQPPELKLDQESVAETAVTRESTTQNLNAIGEIPADDPLWSADLPPAPAADSKRGPTKFSRSSFNRAGDWIDADAVEASPRSQDSRAANDVTESTLTSPEGFTDPAPEPPLESALAPEFTTTSPDPIPPEVNLDEERDGATEALITQAELSVTETEPAATETEPAVVETEPATTETESSIAATTTQVARGPLRIRGSIQQIAAEVSVSSPKPAQQKSRPIADEFTEFALGREFAATGTDVQTQPLANTPFDAPFDAGEDASPTGSDIPVQRFPIQRVLRLRQRLESASSLNPGAWTQDAQESGTTVGKTPPSQRPAVPAGWITVPESEFDAATSDREPEPVEQRSSTDAKRGAVKLRERTRPQLDDLGNAATNATIVPKSPPQSRQPAVGYSAATKWKTIDSESSVTHANSSSSHIESPSIPIDSAALSSRTDGARGHESSRSTEPPKLAPPVSQMAFASAVSRSNPDTTALGNSPPILRLPDGATSTPMAPSPPELPSESQWYQDETRLARKPREEVVVRKNAFAMVDQLAHAMKLPVATLISLVGGGGLVLIGAGLLALRATIRRRYS